MKLTSKLFQGLAALMLAGVVIAAPFVATRVNAFSQDCDTNAVIWCGIDNASNNVAQMRADLKDRIQNGDTKHTGADIQAAYSHFSVDLNEVDSAVLGTVYKNGDVKIGSATVASNVWTAGRLNLGNSDRQGNVWMRPPSVSFNSNSLEALVYAPGGVFQWAVITACGNPVMTINKPFGVIYKHVIDVNDASGTSYAADDQPNALGVAQNTTIKYKVTVTNGGTAPMTNVSLVDDLPAGVELNSNPSLRHITTNLGTINPGENKVFYIGQTQGLKVTAAVGSYVTNQACFTADMSQQGCDTAVIKVNAPTTPQTPNQPQVPNQPQTPNQPQVPNQPQTPAPQTPSAPQTPAAAGGNTTPTSLPKTGAEGFTGILGTGALGYAVTAYRRSKRALVDAVRNKR